MSYVKLIMITWGNLYNKKYLGESNISQIRLKRVSLLRVIALVLCISTTLGLATSCDNNSNAQSNEIDFTETYSGSFETGPDTTDTNGDGYGDNIAYHNIPLF